MPPAVYVLGLAIFAQGTSELMLAGLLPGMAADLGVSVPRAGLLISAFAAGMLVGAPLLAVATLRWPRRATLAAFLAVFALTHVAGALAPGYGVLLATRVLGAFVYAGFWAVASVAAVGLAAADARGRAMSVVAGGLTVATIVGLPGGTLIGQHLGWRAAFWAVAVLSALAMAGVLATLPGGRPGPDAVPRPGEELRAMANPRLWLAYGTTALSTGALLVTFGYLGAMLTDTTGLPEGRVPAVLALYGAGSLLGIAVGGRTSDRKAFGTLYTGIAGTVVVSAALAVSLDAPAAAVPLVFLLGAFGFAANPALNTRVFALAGRAPTLAAATNFSAFNVGITAGPWLGGLAIDAGAGYPGAVWIGAGLGAAALATVALGHALDRRRGAAPAAAREPVSTPAPTT